MSNPVLVEVSRGPLVESRHRGAVAIVAADGGMVLQIGDADEPVFPRSAVKGMQAIALIESGAADRFGLSAEEIALACASHSGEPRHIETARSMLKKAGHDEGCLECGAHWPSRDWVSRNLVKSGVEASAIHNNCSGKHSGFICVACAMDTPSKGYAGAGHPVQQEVRGILESLTGAVHGEENRGTDGCSIPTYAIPLKALALGFARFGTGAGVGAQRAKAAARIRAAVASAPFMVAGTGRACTQFMEATGDRAFIKTGAEGVFCAAFPALGFGVAIKCDDGAGRAAEAVMAGLLERFIALNENAAGIVRQFSQPQLKNWNGARVGAIRLSPAIRG